MVSLLSPAVSSSDDLARLREVVRASRLAVGLIAFPSRALVELSGPAHELTDLHASELPVELAKEQAFAVVLMDCADDSNAIADLLIGLEATLSTSGGESAGRLAELEMRFRRIAHEIDAAGLLDQRSTVAALEAFPGLDDLTGRQREILTRLLQGDRVATISRGMHLAASTVRNHLASIYRKVGVHSQAELIERLHSEANARR